MSSGMPVKVVGVTVLVGAALVGGAIERFAVGMLIFGIVNVLATARGTTWVRAAAVVASLVAFAVPVGPRMLVAVLAWLVWPPAFLVAWALARAENGPPQERSESSTAGTQARVAIAAMIGAVALASLMYRLIVGHGLQQTAALFIGIPALLAIVVTLAVSPRSATGVACKAVTVGLLVSLLFLGEGILCVAMSAPLFYLIAVGIGSNLDRARRESGDRAHTMFSFLAVLALIPMSLEGVTDATSLNRDESVTVARIVHASSEAVQRALFEPPRFDRALPLYLRMGFPRPIATRIERGPTDARWVIGFRGGEMRLDGMEPRAGDLILQLDEVRPGFVRWRAVADDSHMTHFLLWRDVTVEWTPVDAHATQVRWTLRYRRSLDPAWYFGPWERYAARLAAGYLIDAVATP